MIKITKKNKMTTEKIQDIHNLKIGDKLVMTSNSYVNVELSLYTEEELSFLASKVSFGEIIKVLGISAEDTIMAKFLNGQVLEIKPYIFEKIVEEKPDPIHKLGFSIWKSFNTNQSIDNYWSFIEELSEYGLQISPTQK